MACANVTQLVKEQQDESPFCGNPFTLSGKSGNDFTGNLVSVEKVRRQQLVCMGEYEGGMSVWECSWILARYLLNTFDRFSLGGKDVLELGCGHGVPGMWAAKVGKARSVTFQELDVDTLQCVTYPNIRANLHDDDENSLISFISGCWETLPALAKTESCCFDLVVCSEGTYRRESFAALKNILLTCMKVDGQAFFAMKRLYFGVGGGTRDFCSFIDDDDADGGGGLCAAVVDTVGADDSSTTIRDIVRVVW
eukprot:CAMPEP_0113847954 /NCGR_PEP_ID=MMETSP0372-20130328/2181_1 /TAXON_ID=340204 /ORGANISM="Lankesteria abbotti" /LENGTH=251 /DNA_ID=CAMNT_0000817329 /DNA_START=103 /DNA_END=855 /DNA_ORIENTATION=+ /assembly_acc=CAM_ASM_000359